MKKVTQKAVEHFLSNKPFKNTNTEIKVTATSVYMMLFDNCIAERNKHGLFITNCGWFTNTTKERLNALPNVSIQQKKFKWYLNGKEWNGELTKVN